MQVILQQGIPSLGREGDIVKVAQGYAQNFLFPKRLAVPLTPGNLKQLEQKRSGIAKREAALKAEAEALAAKVDGKSVTIKAKVGEEGRLFGSITAKDIAAAVNETFGVEIDRRRLSAVEPIKQTGKTSVNVKFYPGVEAAVQIVVASETDEEQPAAE